MALIKCHECGSEVSAEAKACPKCGAKPSKPTSLTAMLIMILIGIGFVAATLRGAQQPEPETPEQKAEKAAADTRYIVAAATSNLLRDTMRDPDSLKFEVLRVNEDATVVCMEYRARNGFGGLNRELMVVTKDRSSQDPSDWNKRCTKPMYDMMSAAK